MSSIKLSSVTPSSVSNPSFGTYSIFLNALDGDKPYKKDYLGNISPFEDINESKALISISQTGINPPTITEHINNIGVLTGEYSASGEYFITSDSKFTLNKTRINSNVVVSQADFVFVCVFAADPTNKIAVYSQSGDGILNEFFMEIIVLNT